MADFITLTDINGVRETVNVDRIIRVYPHNKGSVVIYGRDHSERYRETPEQIDALLGVTDSAKADIAYDIAMALQVEADKLWAQSEVIHNSSMRDDTQRRSRAFRDAAQMARDIIAKSEA